MAEILKLIGELRALGKNILAPGTKVDKNTSQYLELYAKQIEVAYTHFAFVYDVYRALAEEIVNSRQLTVDRNERMLIR